MGRFNRLPFLLCKKLVKGVIFIKIKKIFSKRTAYALIKKEHDLLDMEDNLKHEGLKVFIFRETPALLRDLSNLSHK